jgi:hypothetical protein
VNLAYLGDALDHWKGSLFSHLAEDGVISELKADPMLTDPDDWLLGDFFLYARLLKIDSDDVIRHERSLARNRGGYFAEIPKGGDVFLDPDVGLATGRVRHPHRYVEPADVMRLLFNGPNRVVAVYQHVRAQTAFARLAVVTARLPYGCEWTTYESGTVAMIFVSLAAGRIEKIDSSFRRLLGRHSAKRVRRGSA